MFVILVLLKITSYVSMQCQFTPGHCKVVAISSQEINQSVIKDTVSLMLLTFSYETAFVLSY